MSDFDVLVHNKCTADTNPAEVHGNSKLSKKPQHGYEIYDVETGDVVKTGISGSKINKNGSPRANSQVNKWNNAEGRKRYEARIVKRDMPNRSVALEWKKKNSMRLWEKGNSMERHKRPRPWEKK